MVRFLLTHLVNSTSIPGIVSAACFVGGCEAARKSADDAVQIHGAYGYFDEYNVERHLRNTKSAVIYEGTSQIHTLMQAAYATGSRKDQAMRCEMPAYNPGVWHAEASSV